MADAPAVEQAELKPAPLLCEVPQAPMLQFGLELLAVQAVPEGREFLASLLHRPVLPGWVGEVQNRHPKGAGRTAPWLGEELLPHVQIGPLVEGRRPPAMRKLPVGIQGVA